MHVPDRETARREALNIRIKPQVRELIDRAAELAGKNRTDFVLDAARWLKRRALPNQASGASRTYAVYEGKRVVGYYALASGAIEQATVPVKFRRNMPVPIPVVVLARLAVDRSQQGRGLGCAMFRDAAHRTAQAADSGDRGARHLR